MGDARFEAIGRLFERARGLPPAERAALLADACPDDDALRAEVEELLRHHDAGDRRLEPPAGAAPGSRHGPYVVRGTLGVGGMGTVHLAEGPEGRVALKIPHPALHATRDARERFRREAEAGRRVVHPNVVRTLGVTERDAIVMEYVEGQTLAGLLEETRPVPEQLCRHIGAEVAHGLAAIHEAGLVHRDLKPANVLITREHAVKVMDLGVALPGEDAARLSRTGQFVGTLRYAAPEQFDAGDVRVDGRADLYALGLVLYELATGSHPIPPGSARSILAFHLRTEPERIHHKNPDLSPLFAEVVHTLLAKEPAARFDRAAGVAELLEAGEESPWWSDEARRGRTRTVVRRLDVARETALYGRETELAVLREAFEAVRGGDGRALLFEGEAGIGKTRLVDEFLAGLADADPDVEVLIGSYPPLSSGGGGGAFRAALREHFGPDGAADALRRLLPERSAQADAFAAMLRGEDGASGEAALPRGARQSLVFELCRALARQRPMVVVIDDLHFAPEEGRDLFAGLAHALRGARILLVGTTRREPSGPWRAQLERLEHVRWCALERLGPKELVHLLVDALGSRALAETLSLLLAEKSDGNPFFAFEILRCLRESGRLRRRDDGSWTTTGAIRYLELPSSVRELLLERAEALGEADREILDLASCCGARFEPALLAEALGLARIPLLRALGRIEREHRLVRSAGRAYRFDHHQVHAALYDRLSPALREEYHARLGEVLEARAEGAPAGDDALLTCEHFARGADPARALPYLDDALERLEARYLHDRARELAERLLAAESLLDDRRRIDLLLRAASHLDMLGRRERQEEMLDEARELAERLDDEKERGRVQAAIGWMHQRTQRPAQAEEAYRASMEHCRNAGYERGVSSAIGNLSAVYMMTGDHERALDHAQRYLARMREQEDLWGLDSGCGNLANILFQIGRMDEAEQAHREQLEHARAIPHRRGECIALQGLATVHAERGDLDEARRLYEASLAIAREVGDRQQEAQMQDAMGLVDMLTGDFDGAFEHFRLARDRNEQNGATRGLAITEIHLGQCTMRTGRLDEARGHVGRALALAREHGYAPIEVYTLRLFAVLETKAGRHDEAERRFRETLAELETRAFPIYGIDTRLQYGEFLLDAGRTGEARVQLEAGRRLAEEVGKPFRAIQAQALLAALPGGDPAEAAAAFAEHRDSFKLPERLDLHFQLWRAGAGDEHLAQARACLDEHTAGLEGELRERVIRSNSLYTDIVAATEEPGR